MSTLPVLRASWATSDDLQQLLIPEAAASVKLEKQDENSGPCIVTCSLQPSLVPSQLLLCSNARMVEVSVQRPGDSTLSYLQTVRCQPQGEHYQSTISLQGAVGCCSLQLKLLSLQGDKSVCTIHQLSFQQQSVLLTPDTAATGSSSSATAQQEASTAVAATDPGASTGGAAAAAPPQQSLSQLDELRLLIQQLHQPGSDEGAPAVPESLQLLHSKATAAPQPGAGAAIKNLSAHIAQGMLFQAAQQRAQQQQQQQQQEEAHLPPQQQQDSGQSPSVAPMQSGSPSVDPMAVQALLSVLQRLEAKVDQLTQGMSAGLQQLDQRLALLEAHCAAGVAGPPSFGPGN